MAQLMNGHSRSALTFARGDHANLHLDGECVGGIIVKRWGDSWGYGDFQPNEYFSKYAPIFGLWSLLMHEEINESVSRAVSEELSRAELQLDAIKSRLYFPENNEWVDIAQLNVDGELLEWKEY